MEIKDLKELQELDDLINVSLTSVGRSRKKPDIIPALDFDSLYIENEEEECQAPPKVVEPLIKKKDIAPRFVQYPPEEINNLDKMNQLKNSRFEKIRFTIKERIEKDKKIRKEKKIMLDDSNFSEKYELNIEELMKTVKSELKLKNTTFVNDLHEIKINNRIKKSMALLRRSREQKTVISSNIIFATLNENLRLIEAHLDCCSKDCERFLMANTKDQFGRTSLHYAAALGFESAISMLLELGSNPFTIDFKGRSPLHYSTLSNNLKSINTLLRACGNFNRIRKNMLTNQNKYTVARLVENRKADHNFSLTCSNNIKVTETQTIFLDTSLFHEGIQKLLNIMNSNNGISSDYDNKGLKYIDWRDNEGRTALHFAVLHEKATIVQALLEAGAAIALEDANDKRPLELSNSKFISALLINKLKQSLVYKKCKNSAIYKESIDNRDLKALTQEDISMYMKNDLQETYLM